MLIIINIIVSISIAFLLLVLFNNSFFNSDYMPIFGVILSTIISLFLHKYVKEKITTKTLIVLDKKVLKINNIIIEINSYKFHLRGFPLFKLKTTNNELLKFRCSNKVDDEFYKFIIEFNKIIKKST